jgi:hypothetical protein
MNGIAIIIVALAPVAVGAQPGITAELEHCAEILDRNQRLECYDGIARRLEEELTPGVQPETGVSGSDWQLKEEISPVDDSRVVYLSLIATETTPAAPGLTVPTLFVRCKEGKVESFINWGAPVGTGTVAVTTRLDDGKAETARWLVSTDFRSTFVRGSPWAFIARLRAHDLLVARLIPLAQNETTAIFSLVGLDRMMRPVEEACGRPDA